MKLLLCLLFISCSDVYGAAEDHKYFLYKVVGTYLKANRDESRIAGQIHVESTWNENAYNRSGARGLGQFMPRTAQWMHRQYNLELGQYSKYSARWSIAATTLYMDYLVKLQKRAPGECAKWLKAYQHYSGGARRYSNKVFIQEANYIRRGWRGQPVC